MSDVNKDNSIHLKVGKDVLIENQFRLCDIDHIEKGYDSLGNEITYVIIHMKFTGSHKIPVNNYQTFCDMTNQIYRANERIDILIVDGVCTLVEEEAK